MKQKTNHLDLARIQREWDAHITRSLDLAADVILQNAQEQFIPGHESIAKNIKAALIAALLDGVQIGFRLKSECPFAFITTLNLTPAGSKDPTAPKDPTGPKVPKAPATPKKEPLN